MDVHGATRAGLGTSDMDPPVDVAGRWKPALPKASPTGARAVACATVVVEDLDEASTPPLLKGAHVAWTLLELAGTWSELAPLASLQVKLHAEPPCTELAVECAGDVVPEPAFKERHFDPLTSDAS